jgi:hypothetical protein
MRFCAWARFSNVIRLGWYMRLQMQAGYLIMHGVVTAAATDACRAIAVLLI